MVAGRITCMGSVYRIRRRIQNMDSPINKAHVFSDLILFFWEVEVLVLNICIAGAAASATATHRYAQVPLSPKFSYESSFFYVFSKKCVAR